MKPEITESRDVDAWIVEHVFGWRTMMTPPDYDGANVSEIVIPPDGIPQGFTFPRKGKIGRGYFAPLYTSNIRDAISFARHVGVEVIPIDLANDVLGICRLAMERVEG